MVGITIKKVVVGISGNHVFLQDCHGVVAVSSENREITNEDIHRVIDAAKSCLSRQIVKSLMLFQSNLL